MSRLLQETACCHPSELAGDSPTYVCRTCGSTWSRYPFSVAPEFIQNALVRHAQIDPPEYFWSMERDGVRLTESMVETPAA